jgi:hypothetical protein
MKKFFAIALACVFILTAFTSCGGKSEETEPTDVVVEPKYTEGLIYVQNDDGCSVIGYEGTDTDIIIPDEYGGYKVTAVGNSAFTGKNITSVVLGANVKRIESAAFAGCKALTRAELGASLETIDIAAFFGCSALSTIKLPATVKKVGVDAFSLCDAVSEIDYDGNQSMWSRVSLGANNEVFNTELVLADGGALVKLIADGDCNANIGWRLGYDGILIITGNGHIPNYEYDTVPWRAYTEQIEAIVVEDGIDVIGKNAFIGCNKAVSVTLASSVRLIENNAFYGCSSLAEITLPERLRRLGENVFFGCSSLKSVVVPESVTAIGAGAFMGCSSLESVTLPAALTVVEKWTFANCTELKHINLEGVSKIGLNAFFRCKYLPTKYTA